jgi:hypothetical protein
MLLAKTFLMPVSTQKVAGFDSTADIQEMLVCAIVGKRLPAIDAPIEYVIPTVLYSDAQGTTH